MERIVELPAGATTEASAAAALLNRELGEGMYAPGRLTRDAVDPTAAVWIAEEGARPVIGAAVARILIPADVGYYERFGPQAVDLFRDTVGSYEAVAVESGSRRRGVGRRLTEAALEWMRRHGCTNAVTLAWLSGREESSPGLFRALGFQEGETVERFYYEESLRDGWKCPVCGNPCRCSATLYTLPL